MIGVIADDFTGATDVAVAFRREGQSVSIVFGQPEVSTVVAATGVIVVALKTRTLPADEAVDQSRRAAKWLHEFGCGHLYFKYCSTFDSTDAGNIGPVADALTDYTGSSITVVTPAAPVHGRTVYHGHLFVGHRLLSESSMKDHPLTPMCDSDLVRLLSKQTERPVGLVARDTVAAGPDAVAESLSRLNEEGIAYAIVDAISDTDLHTIGAAVAEQPLITGSAGLAAGIASALAGSREEAAVPELNTAPRSAVIAGSCSTMTQQQVARFAEANPAFRIDVTRTSDPAALISEALSWYDDLPENAVPLFTSTTDVQTLRIIQSKFGVQNVADTVESALAGIARELVSRGVNRIVVAGGETSGAVTSALGVSAGLIGTEAASGVPWIHTSIEGAEFAIGLELLLKSGNFGEADLLITTTDAKGPDED